MFGWMSAPRLPMMLESTGQLQNSRIYEMTAKQVRLVDDRPSDRARPGSRERLRRSTEKPGRELGNGAAHSKTNANQFPEVKKLVDQGWQSIQYTFSADNPRQGYRKSGSAYQLNPLDAAHHQRHHVIPGATLSAFQTRSG